MIVCVFLSGCTAVLQKESNSVPFASWLVSQLAEGQFLRDTYVLSWSRSGVHVACCFDRRSTSVRKRCFLTVERPAALRWVRRRYSVHVLYIDVRLEYGVHPSRSKMHRGQKPTVIVPMQYVPVNSVL